MEWLQIIVLAVVQGVTEFLPVSSSAHLILVPVFTNWEDQGLAFDVALHLGSLSAVLVFFRRDILAMTHCWTRSLFTRQLDADAKLAWAVLFGTIPVGLAGLAFQDIVEDVLRSPLYLAADAMECSDGTNSRQRPQHRPQYAPCGDLQVYRPHLATY